MNGILSETPVVLVAAPKIEVARALPPLESPTTGAFTARGPFFHRGAAQFTSKGVTYGPFKPNARGEFFPEPERARADFALMRSIGVNTVRLYYPPPRWFADLAHEGGIAILAGIPWPEHVCRLSEPRFRRAVREDVRHAVAGLRGHPAVLGMLVGNEIPTTNVRWAGPRVVENFIGELYDAAKEADPARLVSYANYPSTEYLSLERFDFYTLNLYLHDRKQFRDYLSRMRNLAGDKPFVLGEFGIDVQHEGPAAQSEILRWSLEEAYRNGVAGTFIFSFTDEWFRGGEEVSGWSFGLCDRERKLRPAALAVGEVLKVAPEVPLERTPRVSVVVATYNGGSTLRETLTTLAEMRYPDYETIVIDDGSTDKSAEIAREFLPRTPADESKNGAVRMIQQSNRGLSNARNRGIQAATGEIVAFCDSDVALDPHWLNYLVAALQRTGRGYAGVGGPNLPPTGDGRTAAAVAGSPGGPTHVLLDDVTAEHIPGCNMAFWKKSLEEVGGFDPRFRAAGDDVDICWRLQDRGLKLAYSPSAIVWHHRRNSVRAYLKQQRGYGEAEADLAAKHPGRYNALGGALWRGRIYASPGTGAMSLARRRRIQYGVFGLGLFQTIYQPEGPLFLELAATPEWTSVGLLALVGGCFGSWELAVVGIALLISSAAVAIRGALKAKLEPRYQGLKTRALIAWMTLAQPWVRRRAQLKKARMLHSEVDAVESLRTTWYGDDGDEAQSFWSEEGGERESFLGNLEKDLCGDRFPVHRGTGFEAFDLEVGGDPGARALVSTVMEYHGGPKRLLRLRVQTAFSGGALTALTIGAIASGVLSQVSSGIAIGAGIATFLAFVHFRRRAGWLRRAVLARSAEVARKLGFAPPKRKAEPKSWLNALPLFSFLA